MQVTVAFGESHVTFTWSNLDLYLRPEQHASFSLTLVEHGFIYVDLYDVADVGGAAVGLEDAEGVLFHEVPAPGRNARKLHGNMERCTPEGREHARQEEE